MCMVAPLSLLTPHSSLKFRRRLSLVRMFLPSLLRRVTAISVSQTMVDLHLIGLDCFINEVNTSISSMVRLVISLMCSGAP